MRLWRSGRALWARALRKAAIVEMSRGRSLPGTSLAAKTPPGGFLCFQWFAPGFLESLDAAGRSVSMPGDPAKNSIENKELARGAFGVFEGP
jgi:hypothetical protein